MATATAQSVAAVAQTIPLAGNVEPLTFHLLIPPGATEYLVCVKLDGISKGSVMAGHFTKGMSILKVGHIDHISFSTDVEECTKTLASIIKTTFIPIPEKNTSRLFETNLLIPGPLLRMASGEGYTRALKGRHCTEHGVEPHALHPQLLENIPVCFSVPTMSDADGGISH